MWLCSYIHGWEAGAAMNEGAQFLAVELERLLDLPLQPKSALHAWYEEAGKLRQALRERFPGLVFPHEIWHFLDDADIRSKEDEVEYRRMQEQIVRDYISGVRGGSGAS